MPVKSGFFNSVSGDRKYNAAFFAEYFASFIGNGVFPNPSTNLQVVEGTNMQTVVKPGKGWTNGYYVNNDSDYILQHEVADGVLKRIDRVVMRLNYLTRQIEIAIKKGTYASTPVAPTLQRDTDSYELALADVLINNGATAITQANITDQRLNNDLCGIVHGTVEQVDTTTLFNQYQSWFQQYTADKEIEIDNWQVQEQAEFDTWFATIKDTLSGDVAGNLQAQITTTNNNLTTLDQTVTTHLAEFEQLQTDVGDKTTLATTNKTSLVSAINEAFQFANDGKTAVANAVTAKGVSASPTDTFPTLATKIGQIPVGDYAIGDIISYQNLGFTRPLTKTFPGRKYNNTCWGIGKSTNGIIYIAYGAYLYRYDSDGNYLGDQVISDAMRGMQVVGNNIYFTQYVGVYTARMLKYTCGNGSVCSQTYNVEFYCGTNDFKVVNGYIYVCGYDRFVKLFESSAGLVWSKTETSPVRIDASSSSVYVLVNSGNIPLRRYDAGNPQSYSSQGFVYNASAGVKVLDDNNVFAGNRMFDGVTVSEKWANGSVLAGLYGVSKLDKNNKFYVASTDGNVSEVTLSNGVHTHIADPQPTPGAYTNVLYESNLDQVIAAGYGSSTGWAIFVLKGLKIIG